MSALEPGNVDPVSKEWRLPPPNGPPSLPFPNPTKSFWTHGAPDANPLAREGADGPLSKEADIVIIGSGITGVSAAYHLAQQLPKVKGVPTSQRIVILEARDFCSGATGRNGGHLIAGVLSDFRERIARYGEEEGLKAVLIEVHTVSAILDLVKKHNLAEAVDLQHDGVYLTFENEEQRRAADEEWAAIRKLAGDRLDLTFHDADWMQKEHGIPRSALRLDGRNLWPLKLVTYIYNIAKETSSSLVLHTNTPVTSVTPSGHHWTLHTHRGTITAPVVLHATNAYAAYLLPHLHGPQGIVPTRTQVIATRSSSPPLRPAAYTVNNTAEYFFQRPLSAGEKVPIVIVGGARREAKPSMGLHVSDDTRVNAACGKKLRETLPSTFPNRFKVVEPEFEWTGIMGYTESGDPFVGPVIDGEGNELHGQYIAAGYTGHGMPRAFACAEVIAGIITADIQGKQWTAPEWLPKHYLTKEYSAGLTSGSYSCAVL